MGKQHLTALPDIWDNVCRGSAAWYMKYCGNAGVILGGDNHRRSMSKQHEAPVPSIFAPWISAVQVSTGPDACYVRCLIPLVLACTMFMFLCQGS